MFWRSWPFFYRLLKFPDELPDSGKVLQLVWIVGVELGRKLVDENALDRLRNDLGDFTASVGRRKSGRTMKSRTTASIDDAIARGIEAVRQLDAIVRNKFASNQPVLTAWEQARTVSRPARTTTAQKAAVAASA